MSSAKRRLAMKMHVIDRAAERYAVQLSFIEVGLINGRIRRGEGVEFTLNSKNAKARGVFLEIGGVVLPFVFHEAMHCVSTVLPPRARSVRRGMMQVLVDARAAE